MIADNAISVRREGPMTGYERRDRDELAEHERVAFQRLGLIAAAVVMGVVVLVVVL